MKRNGIESNEEKSALSLEDKSVIELCDSTTELVDNHYELRIPFKEGYLEMPNNLSMAKAGLQGLKRRLRALPSQLDRYDNLRK